ncbi:MAG: hypothetical protein CTY33_00125 [Methylotenera sp.]|nr:MAG: hypothetical protein CTY33_00125 [Methylotenera sp.]
MFYQQQFIAGKLHYRTSPDGEWFPIPLQQQDTITLSITEYEQLLADQKRMQWLDDEMTRNGYIKFDRYGLAWVEMFTISTQKMRQQPNIRSSIDQAISQDKP